MSITIIEPNKGARLERADDDKPNGIDVSQEGSALASELTEEQRARFLLLICDERAKLHGGLRHWRSKMEKWERMSKMDYSDRIGAVNPVADDLMVDIFTYNNDTLGMSEGFVDFAAAQARDDIFGSKPWMAATPVGRKDPVLAGQITKHAQWKLAMSDLEDSVKDAIRIACWGGTAFLKSRWVKDFETFKKDSKPAAFSKATGGAYRNESGDLIFTAEDLEEMNVDGGDIEWKKQKSEETITVYDNSRTDILDYRAIAFDAKAKTLDLAYTPFYSSFRMGILDVINYYKIPKERHKELEQAILGQDEEPRIEDGESTTITHGDDIFESNRPVTLVEGFRRCDLLGTGELVRVHVVFSPTLNILFKLDYLANETPEGELPVFPVRINKIPRRIFGIGYFEKYEKSNDAVDRQHNAVVFRNKLGAQVVVGIHKDALANPDDNKYIIDSRNPVELATDKTLKDFIEFAVFPDMNTRSMEIMNQMLQMAQMRSGITSAAQGELKGVPNASTATGVNQLTSRGALLLKDPISQMTDDIEKLVGYNVDLLYANHDRDETFSYGEGEEVELLTIKAGDVQGLRMNVTLKLVQSQNQQKLANAQAAINIISLYTQLPESEKAAARILYVQAIESLGFNNAEDICRQAVVDAQGILALVPPDVAPVIESALVNSGLMEPSQQPNPSDSAPVTESGG